MQESKSLLELNNRGSILFVYSDKMRLYVIYHDLQEERLYKLVLDKSLIIEAVHELKVPERFKSYRDLQWHKPIYQNNGCFVFCGAVTLANEHTHVFKITDMDVLEMDEAPCHPRSFALLPMQSLEGVEVDVHIQKSNRLYVIGYDKDSQDQLFLQIDLARDKVLRKYTLHSGLGEVIATTLNVDHTDACVYVGGFIREPETLQVLQPYFEQFLMLPSSHL